MLTPSHAIINAAIGKRISHNTPFLPIILGSILPDISMYFFFFLYSIQGIPQRYIWEVLYFSPQWQYLFDLFHSFPLICVGILLCIWSSRRWLLWFFIGMGLHDLGDFFLHHTDAHRHFLPLSDYRFLSPVSYWDPHYYSWIGGGLETIAVIISVWYITRTKTGRYHMLFYAYAMLILIHLFFMVFFGMNHR